MTFKVYSIACNVSLSLSYVVLHAVAVYKGRLSVCLSVHHTDITAQTAEYVVLSFVVEALTPSWTLPDGLMTAIARLPLVYPTLVVRDLSPTHMNFTVCVCFWLTSADVNYPVQPLQVRLSLSNCHLPGGP